MYTAECERPRAWVSLLKASQGVCLNAHSHTALPLTPETAAWNNLLAPAPYCIHWHPNIFRSTLFCCRSSHVWCEVDQALSWRLAGYFQRFVFFVVVVGGVVWMTTLVCLMPSSKTVPSRLVIGTTRRAMCQRIAWEQVGSLNKMHHLRAQTALSAIPVIRHPHWDRWAFFFLSFFLFFFHKAVDVFDVWLVLCGIVWMKWLNQIVESSL